MILGETGVGKELLARHFLRRYAVKYNHPDLDMTLADEAMLLNYSWPGNIRELQNIMERAALLSDGHRLALNLPTGIPSYSKNPFEDMPTLEEMQCRYINYVLEKTEGKRYHLKPKAVNVIFM